MLAVEEFRELERKAERVVVLDYRLWAWGPEIQEVARMDEEGTLNASARGCGDPGSLEAMTTDDGKEQRKLPWTSFGRMGRTF